MGGFRQGRGPDACSRKRGNDGGGGMTRYAFNGSPSGRLKRAGPQSIGEALDAIRVASGGELHPGPVVDSARDEASPLHRYFEWNDAKAAEQHRLDQARQLIRGIRVIDDDNRSTPAFLSIRDDRGIAYHAVQDVLSSADLRTRLLLQAERDLTAWTARYRELQEIVALVEPARQELRRRVRKPGGEEARPFTDGLARLGSAKPGPSRHGAAVPSRARPGTARQCQARLGWHGRARRGTARLRVAGHGEAGRARLCAVAPVRSWRSSVRHLLGAAGSGRGS